MIELALSALETAINQYLRLDPNTIVELQSIQDKTIQVQLTDWNCDFYLQPSTNGINLFATHPTPADTVIKGKLSGLVNLGLGNNINSKSLFDNQVTLSGDLKTGEKIREILQGIDIDWEDHLAKITGDSMANLMMRQAKRVLQFTKECAGRLQEQCHDYIHNEARLTPSKAELDRFYSDVTELRYATERLETKLQRKLHEQNKLHESDPS